MPRFPGAILWFASFALLGIAASDAAPPENADPALHGWCVPDMPQQNGAPIYKKDDAERAWGKLVALYKAALA